MSIRVYVNGDILIEQKAGRFPGVKIHDDNGCSYFVVNSTVDQFDPALKRFINKITLFEQLPAPPKRIEGVYKKDPDTEARLVYIPQTDNYSLLISGKTTSDVDALYRLVRAGTVQPAENWEAAQEGADEPPKQTEEERDEEEVSGLEMYFRKYTPTPSYYVDYDQLLATARTLDTILAYAVEGDGGTLYFDGTHFHVQTISSSTAPPVRLHEITMEMAYDAIGYLSVFSVGIDPHDVQHMQEGTFYYPYRSKAIPLHVTFFPHRGDLLVMIRFPSRRDVELMDDSSIDQRVFPFSLPSDPSVVTIGQEAKWFLLEELVRKFSCIVTETDHDRLCGDILRVATSRRFRNLEDAVELMRDVYAYIGDSDEGSPFISFFQVTPNAFDALLERYRAHTVNKP